MKNQKLKKYSELNENEEIYRYLKFSQFMAMIETKSTYFSIVSSWDDPWENVFSKLPKYNEKLDEQISIDNEEYMYGQCWSLTSESDALWRIYSPYSEGVVIKSRVSKLSNINGYNRAAVGKVEYFSDLAKIDLAKYGGIKGYLLKRKAFKHEEEVRLLVDYHFMVNKEKEDYIQFDIDINNFIEEVIIDPRASKWFEDMVILYCNSKGISKVYKSKLYDVNVYETTGLAIVYRTVE